MATPAAHDVLTRHVVLLCGPPCSGKTTYARQHARPGEIVADFDAYAIGAGSPRRHLHSKRYREAAGYRMAQAEHWIATTDDVQAWVIRTLPHAAAREALAHHLRATSVVVLLPPLPVLLHRAQHRPSDTARRIHQWLARYTPRDGDVVITDADGAERPMSPTVTEFDF